MGNSFLNIRIFNIHLMWDKGNWLPHFQKNGYHPNNGWPDGYFSVYDFPFLK